MLNSLNLGVQHQYYLAMLPLKKILREKAPIKQADRNNQKLLGNMKIIIY